VALVDIHNRTSSIRSYGFHLQHLYAGLYPTPPQISPPLFVRSVLLGIRGHATVLQGTDLGPQSS
jgi:hypothetical protein